jgi:hypothetical protein
VRGENFRFHLNADGNELLIKLRNEPTLNNKIGEGRPMAALL